MAILNGNNYLIWEGEFTDAPYALEAVDDTADIVENADSIQIEPLLNDVATYGIDNSTFEFTLQDNGVNPASFDALTGIITYYPPAISAGQTRLLKYRFRDNAGNLSNEATISISVLARATAWRGLASSYACLQSGGFNTGQANYATLEEYYTDDNSPVVPASTKPNDISDPEYIAPVDDPVSCPLPSASEDFYIWNFAGGNIPDTEITRIEFNKNGGRPNNI